MTQHLEPCPLCGNGVRSFIGLNSSDDVRFMEVECDCGLDFYAESRIYAWNHHDEAAEVAELEAKWNKRAVCTCRVTQTGCATGICSSCGGEFQASVCTNQPPDYVQPASFCPSCGAKIEKVVIR